MIYYFIYDITGKILRSGFCPKDMLSAQTLIENEFLIESEEFIDFKKYYYKDNILKPIPESPGRNYEFDTTLETWQLNQTTLIAEINSKRVNLLYASDWTQLPGNPLTPEIQQQWATYRQQLRDIPNQLGYPVNITWPTAPGA